MVSVVQYLEMENMDRMFVTAVIRRTMISTTKESFIAYTITNKAYILKALIWIREKTFEELCERFTNGLSTETFLDPFSDLSSSDQLKLKNRTCGDSRFPLAVIPDSESGFSKNILSFGLIVFCTLLKL